MKWRAFVLLSSGLFLIYLVSLLLQDAPYPHPITMQTETTIGTEEATQVLLAKIDDYFYKTQIFFDATLKGNQGRLLGINTIQLNVHGYITQSRKKSINGTTWEHVFSHSLSGPITHYSTLNDNNQFAVLYHIVDENENLNYYARVYFVVDGQTEYKDLHFPGNTMINSFTLEKDTILYSRDPDQFRFRVIQLPKDLFTKKRAFQDDDTPIHLGLSEPGELVKTYHQPKGSNDHVSILSQLYSSDESIYRVLSLDVHQTKKAFYINATLVDGIRNENNEIEWLRRDHLNTSHNVYVDINLEYMTFVDGVHQEPTKITLPPNLFASIYNKKTVVLPILANSFLTVDYTNNTERLLSDSRHHKYLYKKKNSSGDYLPEIYFWMQDDIYDDHGVKGIQLNQQGTVLAVWTDSNSVYIYKRGHIDKSSENLPHNLDRKLEWILKMMISPVEGGIGTRVPIGNALFWNKSDLNYLSIILKNGAVNTYLIDAVKQQNETNIKNFIREKWDLWIVMSIVIALFVANEIKNHP